MGGGIAQEVAVRSPERVLSLTLVATCAAFDRADPAPLPPPDARIRDFVAPEVDWGDAEASVEALVDTQRVYAGTGDFEEEVIRAVARDVVRRTPNLPASLANHWAVVGGGEDSPSATMADIAAPTLVVHGTDDPLFPLPHGEALAREIAGARLLVLDGMGHEVPPRWTWDRFVPALVERTGDPERTSGARQR